MRHAKSLAKLQQSCVKRLGRLQQHIDDLKGFRVTATDPLRRRMVAHLSGAIVIDLLNTWTNFAKSYFISCMLGTRSVRGLQIQPAMAVVGVNAAIGEAVKMKHPNAGPNLHGKWDRRSEPTWHEPTTLIDLATHCKLSHEQDVIAAFAGGYSRTFVDLPVVRNFFAHRNLSTSKAALQVGLKYGILSPDSPSDLILSFALNRTEPLILDWAFDIQLVVDYLCQ